MNIKEKARQIIGYLLYTCLVHLKILEGESQILNCMNYYAILGIIVCMRVKNLSFSWV